MDELHDCIKTIHDNTIAKLSEKYPDRTYEPADDNQNGLDNRMWNFQNNGDRQFLSYPFVAHYTFEKVSGESSARKTQKLNLYGNFCPFCGKRISGEEETTNG